HTPALRYARNRPFEFRTSHVNVVMPFDRSCSHVRQWPDYHFGGGEKLAGQMTVCNDDPADQTTRLNFSRRRVDYFHIRSFVSESYSLLDGPFRTSRWTA